MPLPLLKQRHSVPTTAPFDRHLRREEPLSPAALRGMDLFYGKAQCQTCHAGTFQTDHNFYAIAMPQIGPGKADGRDATYWRATGQKAFLEDFGRGRVTVREQDLFQIQNPFSTKCCRDGPLGTRRSICHTGSSSSAPP